MLVDAAERGATKNLEERLQDVNAKRQQKLWDIYAKIDRGKRDVHCAKRWAAAVHENLWVEQRGAVQRVAQDMASHISKVPRQKRVR